MAADSLKVAAFKTARKPPGRPFEQGNNANPAGRPKGSRNKLGEAFIADLYADWQLHGADAIKVVRETRPQDYLKVTASLLPKQLQLESKSDLSDDELDERIRQILKLVDLAPGLPAGRDAEDDDG